MRMQLRRSAIIETKSASRTAVIQFAIAVLAAAWCPSAQPLRADDRTGPGPRATPELVARPLQQGADIETVWSQPPLLAGPRDRAITLLWENGPPIDDFNDPATQLSWPPTNPPWQFIAAVADDFILEEYVLPNTSYRITSVRAAFAFFNIESGDPTPLTTWDGIHVTVYANSADLFPGGLDTPSGAPDVDVNGQLVLSGVVVATQFVPVASLTEELAGTCRPHYIVDIPLTDLHLAKNRRYWLSLVPEFPGPPQTAWCFSWKNRGFVAQIGFPLLGVPFWHSLTPEEGNCGCPNSAVCGCPLECEGVGNPPPGASRDMTFQIYGEELPPTQGACCNESTGVCTEVLSEGECIGSFDVFHPGAVCELIDCAPLSGACCDDTTSACTIENIADCQGATQRFSPGLLCNELDPPCGTMTPGACCFDTYPQQTCQDLPPTDCENAGGLWNEGDCISFACPPFNDACANAVLIQADGAYEFNTLGAVTDGPPIVPQTGCVDVNQDVWFRYMATCTGTLVVSLCVDTNYDAALAVYEGCQCPPNHGVQSACDNDACAAGGPSEVSFPVNVGSCYLIRVGGAGAASGSGTLIIGCLPVASGACCHYDLTCEILPEAQCDQQNDTYFASTPCSLVECPPPPFTACCVGDNNRDELLDGADIDPLVQRLLSPPALGTREFCEADIDGDLVIGYADIAPFVQKLLNAQTCPVVDCCHGDVNGDSILDGTDVQGLLDALTSTPPESGTLAFCRVDANADQVLDMQDAAAFIQLLMNDANCPP